MSDLYSLSRIPSTGVSFDATIVPETSTVWEYPSTIKKDQIGMCEGFEGYFRTSKNATAISKETSIRLLSRFYGNAGCGFNDVSVNIFAPHNIGIFGDIVSLCGDDTACILPTEEIVKKLFSDIYKLTPRNSSKQLALSEVFINEKKAVLHKPLLLNIQLEDKHYILSQDELGLLAISSSPKQALKEIQEEFSDLWKEYVTCPEEELTEGAKRLRAKLQSVVE